MHKHEHIYSIYLRINSIAYLLKKSSSIAYQCHVIYLSKNNQCHVIILFFNLGHRLKKVSKCEKEKNSTAVFLFIIQDKVNKICYTSLHWQKNHQNFTFLMKCHPSKKHIQLVNDKKLYSNNRTERL